jgi:hypothetical protein
MDTNMKKIILVSCVVLFLCAGYFRSSQKIQTHQASPTVGVKTYSNHDLESVNAARMPAQDLSDAESRVKTLTQNKQKRKPWNEEERKDIKLPGGLSLAKNVFAIPIEDFSPSMGEQISVNPLMIFFRTANRPLGVANVAMDKLNHKLYVVNSVVKLQNISEVTRQDLLAKGFEENYYHESLGIMYVQSTHDEVIKLYSDFMATHFAASLEVTRSFHLPK